MSGYMENPWEEGPCFGFIEDEPDELDRDDAAYHERVDRGLTHED